MAKLSKAVFAAASLAGAVALASAQGTASCEAADLEFRFGGIPGCGPSFPESFDGCCGNLQPEEGGSTGTVGGGSGSGGSELTEEEAGLCRTMTTSAPFCSNPNVPSGGCAGFVPTAVYTMLLELAFTYPDPEEECCLKCKCYGDPLCEAFDGSTDEFIECDGRNDTTCQQSRDVCKQQFDHSGRRCDWLKNNDKYPDYVNNLVSGSPCQADYAKVGNMEILMYSADGFSVNTFIGERGVIVSAEIGMPGVGTFAIDYESCALYDPRVSATPEAAWTMPDGVTELPHNWEVTTPNAVDIVWHVGSVEIGVFVDVVCTRATGAERGRLDIQNLIETQLNRDGEGYCFTGVINRGSQSGSNVQRRGFHLMCLNMLLPDNIDTCKRLSGDGACKEDSLTANQEAWCEQAELIKTMAEGESRAEQVASCKADLAEGDSNQQSQTWITYACQMNTPNSMPVGGAAQASYVGECVQVVSQFGWEEWLAQYETLIPYVEGSEAECANSLSEYTVIGDDVECANGVMVQVLKDGEWVEQFYIPATKPPCEGVLLEADGETYPELFLYQVRLRQCGLGAECLANEDGTNCAPLPEVEAQVTFEGVTCAAGGGNCSTCVRDVGDLPPQVCEESSEEPYRVGNCDQCCETLNFLPGQEEQQCRELVVDTPYCDTTTEGAVCTALGRPAANGQLELEIIATAADFSEECCKSCQLWGDPFGQAFDGSREKLIICDSRDETCFSNKDKCLSFKDHAGNTCTYNDTTAALIVKRGDIGAYGSPCLPDWEASGEAPITMYDTPDPFKVVFLTGERSILTTMNVTTPLGLYNLDPTECFTGAGDTPGWSVLEGAPLDEAFNIQYFTGGEAGYGAEERAFAVTDLETGIFMKITCVFARSVTRPDVVGNYRLNIEKLIDLDLERAEASGNSDYCRSADLRQFGGEYTPNVVAEACEDDLQNDHLAAKAFWAGSATPSQVELGVQRWCGFANIATTVDACVSYIYSGPNRKARTASRWLERVCEALIPARTPGQTPAQHMQFCQSLGNTDGYFSVVERYGSAGSRSAVSSFCASSVTEYGKQATQSNPCMTGIKVEYFNSNSGQWVESFFIPGNKLPCDGKLVIPADDSRYFPLFVNPVRFEQCDLNPATCPAADNVEPACMSAFGYELIMTYSSDVVCP